MECNEFVLTVRTSAHLGGAAYQHTHLPGTDFGEQFLFPHLRVGFMDVGDFLWRHSFFGQLLLQIIVDIEGAVTLGSGQVAEHKLGAFLLPCPLPNRIDIPGADGGFAGIAVRGQRIDQPHIQC